MSSADGFVPSHLPAHRGVTFVRAWAENSPLHRVCLAGELTLARAQLAVAERERRLLRARFERVPAANRPHFAPAERLEIRTRSADRVLPGKWVSVYAPDGWLDGDATQQSGQS